MPLTKGVFHPPVNPKGEEIKNPRTITGGRDTVNTRSSGTKDDIFRNQEEKAAA